MEARKIACTSGLCGMWRCCHDRVESVLCSQSQHARREMPMRWRSGNPRPPSEIGRHTCRQLTRQCPLAVSLRPYQRKLRMSLLICLSTGGSMAMARSVCTGMAAERQAVAARHHGCPPRLHILISSLTLSPDKRLLCGPLTCKHC